MADLGQRGFEDLECYQLAMQVMKEAYRVAGSLPSEEKYKLNSQIRRAAASVVLSIAEGYGRFHYLDGLRFYYIARGSLDETLSAFIACHELKYTTDQLPTQRDLCHAALRSLNGFIRYTRKKLQGKNEYGEKAIREHESEYHTYQGVTFEEEDAQFPRY